MDPRLMIGPQGPQLGGISLTRTPNKTNKQQANFGDLFQKTFGGPSQNDDLHISAHAQKRLTDRNIPMDNNLKNSLSNAMNELSEKGAKDSLVITKEGAFLVNVPNRTLVTAMDHTEMRDGIVTNIDSVSMKYQ